MLNVPVTFAESVICVPLSIVAMACVSVSLVASASMARTCLPSARTAAAVSVPPPAASHAGQPVTVPVVLEAAGRARLDFVDAAGHLVRRLDLSHLAAGYQEVEWDGKNDAGRVVAPGAYRGWLVAGDVRLSTRLVRVP